MHGLEDLKERAAKAVDKKAALGPDIDLGQFSTAPVPHTYLADEDLCELPPEEQQRLIMAGLDVTQKDRSGTFFQKDTSVIHCHSQQQGIEVMPIRKALEQEWIRDYYWKLAAVDARLPVNSHADFHFVVTEREPRLAHFRHDTRRQRHAHRPDVGNGFVGNPFDFLKGCQFVGFRAGNLVNKENAGNPPALVFCSF